MLKALNGQEAIIDFGSPDFTIIKPGDFVRCAVTGDRIPLDALRYWSAKRNEAYRDAVTAAQRLSQLTSET